MICYTVGGEGEGEVGSPAGDKKLTDVSELGCRRHWLALGGLFLEINTNKPSHLKLVGLHFQRLSATPYWHFPKDLN